MIFKKRYTKNEYNLQQFVEQGLDGADYDNGAVEQAQAQAENVTKAFARLLATLADKKILSQAEIYKIVEGYMSDDWEL